MHMHTLDLHKRQQQQWRQLIDTVGRNNNNQPTLYAIESVPPHTAIYAAAAACLFYALIHKLDVITYTQCTIAYSIYAIRE